MALIGVGIVGLFILQQLRVDEHEPMESINENIKLPEPKYDSNTSVEQALFKRRSVREYKDTPL
ncbi:MAG: nitroreductase, partial [bacterium]|nr:nitroreductase [bacterium]